MNEIRAVRLSPRTTPLICEQEPTSQERLRERREFPHWFTNILPNVILNCELSGFQRLRRFEVVCGCRVRDLLVPADVPDCTLRRV